MKIYLFRKKQIQHLTKRSFFEQVFQGVPIIVGGTMVHLHLCMQTKLFLYLICFLNNRCVLRI